MQRWRCCDSRVAPEDGADDDEPESTFVRSQECQDVEFLIGYVIYIGCFLGILAYITLNCSVSYFLFGGDSWGNVCGGKPDSLVELKGFEEYSQLKVESINIWRATCNLSDVQICVQECPSLPLNSSSCRNLLSTNGYEQNAVAQKYCDDQCFTTKQGNATVLIFNRCMDVYAINSSYAVVKSYVTEFHYATLDVQYAFVVGLTIVIISAALCISANVFIIRYPAYGSIFCYGACLLFSAVSCVQASIGLARHVPKFRQELDASNFWVKFLLSSHITVYSLEAIVSSGVLFYAACKVAFFNDQFNKARGLWLSASTCISANPKILSQPLLTLFAFSVAALYIIFFSFLLADCQSVTRSPDEDKVMFENNTPIWMFALLVLSYWWFIKLITSGQSAVFAGAAAAWYFTRHDHPISFSLRAILKCNLGSLVAATFSGRLCGTFARSLCAASSIAPYFSSRAPISIGVYGKVKKLALDDDTQGEHPSKEVAEACEVVRNALLMWQVAVTQVAVCVFLWAFRQEDRFYLPIFPVFLTAFLTWNLTGYIIGCMRDTMVGIAVCICEDFARNNGVDKLYYCDRKVAHIIYGVIHPLAATRYGKQRLESDKQHARKASLFAFNRMWTRKSVRASRCPEPDLLDDIDMNSSFSSELPRFRMPRLRNASQERHSFEDENTSIPTQRHFVLPMKYGARGVLSNQTPRKASADGWDTSGPEDQIRLAPEQESSSQTNTDAVASSSKDKDAISSSPGRTPLVAFTEERRWGTVANQAAKMLRSSSKGGPNEVKTIKSVREDSDSADEWH